MPRKGVRTTDPVAKTFYFSLSFISVRIFPASHCSHIQVPETRCAKTLMRQSADPRSTVGHASALAVQEVSFLTSHSDLPSVGSPKLSRPTADCGLSNCAVHTPGAAPPAAGRTANPKARTVYDLRLLTGKEGPADRRTPPSTGRPPKFSLSAMGC